MSMCISDCWLPKRRNLGYSADTLAERFLRTCPEAAQLRSWLSEAHNEIASSQLVVYPLWDGNVLLAPAQLGHPDNPSFFHGILSYLFRHCGVGLDHQTFHLHREQWHSFKIIYIFSHNWNIVGKNSLNAPSAWSRRHYTAECGRKITKAISDSWAANGKPIVSYSNVFQRLLLLNPSTLAEPFCYTIESNTQQKRKYKCFTIIK